MYSKPLSLYSNHSVITCNSKLTRHIVCTHTAMPEVQWNINDTVELNGSINGSFTTTANPCPEVKVIISNHCSYQTKLVTIDNYTVTVELMIASVTEEC